MFDEVVEADGLVVLSKAEASPKVGSTRAKQIVISFFTVVLLNGKGLFCFLGDATLEHRWRVACPRGAHKLRTIRTTNRTTTSVPINP
jgi:hypothetical protein